MMAHWIRPVRKLLLLGFVFYYAGRSAVAGNTSMTVFFCTLLFFMQKSVDDCIKEDSP